MPVWLGARKLDQNAKLLTAARLLRELLPGDSRFGDPLSTSGPEGPQVATAAARSSSASATG